MSDGTLTRPGAPVLGRRALLRGSLGLAAAAALP